MKEVNKEELISQFSEYLDSAELHLLNDDDKDTVDLFSLFKELTELKNEVKIESRQVKSALSKFSEVFDELKQNQQSAQLQTKLQLENHTNITDKQTKNLLIDLLKLRDSINESITSFEKLKKPRSIFGFDKHKTQEHILALKEGQVMILKRLDAILRSQDVTPIDVVGHPLDPHTSRALKIRNDNNIDTGIVISEVNKGFYWKSDILRTAEVEVNKQVDTHE